MNKTKIAGRALLVAVPAAAALALGGGVAMADGVPGANVVGDHAGAGGGGGGGGSVPSYGGGGGGGGEVGGGSVPSYTPPAAVTPVAPPVYTPEPVWTPPVAPEPVWTPPAESALPLPPPPAVGDRAIDKARDAKAQEKQELAWTGYDGTNTGALNFMDAASTTAVIAGGTVAVLGMTAFGTLFAITRSRRRRDGEVVEEVVSVPTVQLPLTTVVPSVEMTTESREAGELVGAGAGRHRS